MHREIDRVIVESSIVFVSIFATIGLLIGASQSQFKTTYVYLGYMLYYSFPFILSCSFGVMAMLSASENSLATRVISRIGVTFFITGLIMLILLASSAAQTSLLPTTFLFFLPYVSVPIIEFFVFFIIFAVSVLLESAISEYRRLWRFRNWILSVSSLFFIIALLIMMTFGTTQTTHIVPSNTALLVGAPNYPINASNFTLGASDQILVTMQTIENGYFNYVFLDESNYLLYNDSSTRSRASVLKSDSFVSNTSFTAVAGASSNYYLVLQSSSFAGTNVTYSATIFSTDSSVEVYALFVSVGFLSLSIAALASKPSFYGIALTLPKDKQRRRSW
jgi:hypothetical protein